ncbi:hypothetical protein CBW24_02010 [Pacificitalea manganoxidans]|uniref:Abortive infection bacteriophage resistance protein n=1 Tax=Pacificitalea manganoxidans TaxID=1411902 RepID=A0A291M2T5_9RHOB|nr:hypothetical protein CBW24_02010 [Pacificitalea manganoxidans]
MPVPEQIKLLRSRGMVIEDEAKASEYLQRIGYYRLSAYWHPMRARAASGEALDTFVAGTTFKEATDLYTFDGRLRLIMLDALERLEVSLRTEIALTLGQHGPKAHRDLEHLGPSFAKPRQRGGVTLHREWLARLDQRAGVSKDRFAEHFRTKYPNDDMPVWIAVELLDFGPLSYLLSGMRNTHLAQIGSSYGSVKPNFLRSWARSLAFTRNVCAHHSRLWNKPLVNQPKISGRGIPKELSHLTARDHAGKRLYSISCVCRYMLIAANPRTSWKDRFVSHIATFPSSPRLSLASAGFPNDWLENELWM